MITENCKNIFAVHFPFWHNLSADEQEGFCQNTVELSFKKGQHINSAVGQCLGVIYVKKGGVRAYMLSDEGREITLFRLSKNDTCAFTASCVLNEITFEVFVDAEEDTDVLLLKSNYFNELFKNNIYVQNYTYKIMVERFSEVMWAMQQILFMSFDKRLAMFLLEETEKSGSEDIKLTHEQIAKYMGSAREVVSRMLKYFESDGLVTLSRGGVKIVDKKRLMNQTI